MFLCAVSIAVADTNERYSTKFCIPETETYLLKSLLNGYDRRVRPEEKTGVDFGLSLQEIISYKEEGNGYKSFVFRLWHTLRYHDARLQWDETKYGGVSTVRLPLSDIWIPDVKLFNSLRPFTDYSGVDAVVFSNGDVLIVPSVNEEVMCSPVAENQWKCDLKYGSWAYDASKLNFTSQSKEVDLSTYSKRIHVESTACKRNEVKYPGIPDIYTDITCSIIIKDLLKH